VIKARNQDELNELREMFGCRGWKDVFIPQLRQQRDNLVIQFVYNPGQVDPAVWREAVKAMDFILNLESRTKELVQPETDPVNLIEP
jgi:hypothetical protein